MSNTKITLGDVRIFRAGEHSDVSIFLSQEISIKNNIPRAIVMGDTGEFLAVEVNSVNFVCGELL